MDQDLIVIQNFNVLPKQSLEILREKLGLRMKPAELTFCARHYKGRTGADINTCELRFMDALACPAATNLSKIALGEMMTDHTEIARTFANAISKLKALGKDPEKSYTLQDLAALSVRYIATANAKDITEPVGFDGSAPYYASKGYGIHFPLECLRGRFDVLQKLSLSLQPHAEYADAIVLLCPTRDTQSEDFDRAVSTLLQSEACTSSVHCICDLSHQSAAHALLHVSNGCVLNLAGLPEPFDHPLALTACHTGLLLALPQSAVAELIQAALSLGMGAYDIGLADHAGYMIVKRGKETLLTLSVPFLRSICFIRSYTVQVDRMHTESKPINMPLLAPTEALDECCEAHDTVLRTLPPLRTRNASKIDDTTYHAAIICAAHAYCTAMAAGSDPAQIWLDARVFKQKQASTAKVSGELLGAILGLYRFSVELCIPVHTNAVLDAANEGVAVLASAPSDMVIPSRLQGKGRIYLLSPKCGADGMPVWSELRALIAYLRNAMLTGKVKCVRAICGNTPAHALSEAADAACGVILNPYGMRVLDSELACAFLAEADTELEGELIAVSTLPEYAKNAQNSDNNS